MTAREHEKLGDRLLARGQLHSAYLHYEKALQGEPDNHGLEYKKGLTFLKAGRGDEAITQFELVLSQKPRHAPAWEGLGRAFFVKKDFVTSESHFLKAVSMDGKLWLSYNYLGAIYDRRKDWRKASEAYQTAVDLRPDEGLIHNNIGMSRLMAKQYVSAATSFQKALVKGFTHAKVFNNLGVALAHLGYTDAALEAFSKAGGQARAYNNLGCVYLKERRLTEAVACFEKAIAMEPVYYVKASENLKRAKMADEQP
jgi:Flp pilus assembly protein TadD